MTQLSDNIFQQFCKLSQSVQNVQKRVENGQMNQESRVAFHRELESLQASMEKMCYQASNTQRFFSHQFEEIESQIISLYRIVEERFESTEIEIISTKALRLAKSLKENTLLQTAKKVDDLRQNIHFLFKHRKPSLKHRKIVLLAEKLSNKIEEALSSKGETSKEHLQMIYLLRTLLLEAVAQAQSTITPEDGELAMELYEIADLFQKRRENEARMKLNLIRSKLSSSQLRRLDEADNFSKEMVEILLEIARGDPCVEWNERSTESVIHELHA